MSRPLRLNRPDSIYHAYDRGVEQRSIFLSERDHRVFLGYLQEAVGAAKAALLSYCLMPNHFHLQLAVRNVPLSELMHSLLTRYSLYFNRAYDRVGHLFQGRFGDEICEDTAYLIHTPVYIHRNPVKAKLVARVEDWPWSGHRELASGKGDMLDLSPLPELAGIEPEEFRRLYLERLAAKLDGDDCEDPDEMLRRLAGLHGVSIAELRGGGRGERHRRVKAELVSWARARGIGVHPVAQALGCGADAVRQIFKRYCHVRA